LRLEAGQRREMRPQSSISRYSSPRPLKAHTWLTSPALDQPLSLVGARGLDGAQGQRRGDRLEAPAVIATQNMRRFGLRPKALLLDPQGDSRIAAGLIQVGAEDSRHAVSSQIASELFCRGTSEARPSSGSISTRTGFKHRVRKLRRDRRRCMRRLAKTHRSTRNDHVHRNARLGSRRSPAMTPSIIRANGGKRIKATLIDLCASRNDRNGATDAFSQRPLSRA
jgi:hypothetical protein